MTIGQLSKITDLSIHTIRYYESLKLIPKPTRTPKGYRKFTGEYIKKVKIIKKFQEFGFTLKEIKTISNFDDCKEINAITLLKLKETQNKIKYYKNLEKELIRLIKTCPLTGSIDECPVIKLINKKLASIKSDKKNENLYNLVPNM
jgi:MerR family mercuric resistance operon transcriptional regulator